MIMFSALSISTLLKVNKTDLTPKENENIYRTPFFPFVPVVYVLSAIYVSWGVIQFHLSQGSILPVWGLAFLFIGCVVYLIWQKWVLKK